MPFLLKDSPRKLKMEKTHGILIILFYVSLIFPQLQRSCILYKKHKKTTTLQQKTGGNILNLVLKKMLEIQNSTTQGNIRILRLKKRLRNLYEK